MDYLIGVDVGGTFTDFTTFDKRTKTLLHFKDRSTPDDPSRAIVEGILHMLEVNGKVPSDISYLAHGTTVATNALIEKTGGKVGLITTKGFKAVMEIGDQKRPSLYDLRRRKPDKLIKSGLECEIEERILYDGTIKVMLNEDEVRCIARYLKKEGVEAIAICTLFSFINPVHEQRIRNILLEEYPEVYITISSELIPEFREYTRMSTTILNAYLGPIMKEYVEQFEESISTAGIKAIPYITQSNGSVVSINETIDYPIRTAVSGPSAGVVGAMNIGRKCKIDRIITFD